MKYVGKAAIGPEVHTVVDSSVGGALPKSGVINTRLDSAYYFMWWGTGYKTATGVGQIGLRIGGVNTGYFSQLVFNLTNTRMTLSPAIYPYWATTTGGNVTFELYNPSNMTTDSNDWHTLIAIEFPLSRVP